MRSPDRTWSQMNQYPAALAQSTLPIEGNKNKNRTFQQCTKDRLAMYLQLRLDYARGQRRIYRSWLFLLYLYELDTNKITLRILRHRNTVDVPNRGWRANICSFVLCAARYPGPQRRRFCVVCHLFFSGKQTPA